MLWQVFVPAPSRHAGARRTSLYLDKWIHNLDREAARMFRSSSINIKMRRVTRRILFDQHISYMGTQFHLPAGITERDELGPGRRSKLRIRYCHSGMARLRRTIGTTQHYRKLCLLRILAWNFWTKPATSQLYNVH